MFCFHSNKQTWEQTPSGTIKVENNEEDVAVGVTSSTTSVGVIGGESDEEENEDRGSRFKTERTNVISLKNVSSGKTLKDIPDSLDKVQTAQPTANNRSRGGIHRGGRGGVRGRLGPMPRGGMAMRGGFGPMGPMRPMRPPHMMHPHVQQQMAGPKIHVNPHFRGGMHQPPSIWDNERLPPPPGCDGYGPPPNAPGYLNDGSWGPPHPMPVHQFPPHHSGHPGGQFQNPQTYPPEQPQGYAEPQPPIHPPQQNEPTRRVQFSENSQLVTVENQHFQPLADQNYGPVQNQFQPPQNTLPTYNNFPDQRPDFHQQPYSSPNPPPNNMGYSQPGYQTSPSAPPYQHFDNTPNNWNPLPGPVPIENHQNNFCPPNQPPQTPGPYTYDPQPPQPQFRPTFVKQSPNFRSPPQQQFASSTRVSVMKRLAPRQPPNSAPTPTKLMRFEHKPTTIIRSNLQEIKTVDTLPDTTSKEPEPEPEPEIEEDEETKQYRLKIAEQKALREKVLKEKEARRLASIIEKQRQQENSISTVTKQANNSQLKPQTQQQSQPNQQNLQKQQQRPQIQQHPPRMQQPSPRMQQPPLRMRMQQPRTGMQPGMRMQPPGMRIQQPGMRIPQPGMRMQQPGMWMPNPRMRMQPPRMPMQPPQMQMQQPRIQVRMQMQQPQMQQQQQRQFAGRGRGRGGRNTVNKVVHGQKPQNTPAKQSDTAEVKIQNMLGTVYKIVKVRTKEGAIVTRKTPLVKNEANNTLAPMKIVNTSGPVQRRIVVNNLQETPVRLVNNSSRGGAQNNIRMASAKQIQESTLYTTNNVPKPASQRVVIDCRTPNVVNPDIPVSTLVTIDNLSLSTSKKQLQSLASQVGRLSSFKHEPELKRATLKFHQPKEAEQFYTKFHRKMIDLSRITVTVIPE